MQRMIRAINEGTTVYNTVTNEGTVTERAVTSLDVDEDRDRDAISIGNQGAIVLAEILPENNVLFSLDLSCDLETDHDAPIGCAGIVAVLAALHINSCLTALYLNYCGLDIAVHRGSHRSEKRSHYQQKAQKAQPLLLQHRLGHG